MAFHQDNTPSRVLKKNNRFSGCVKNYAKPNEWKPKSPDAVPMDYSIWRYLKQQLNKQNVEMLKEL